MKKIKILFVVFISVLLGICSGYYFKKPDSTMLGNALTKSTEWKKELYIEALRSKTPFFQLETINTYTRSDGEPYYSWSGDFIFNWLAFILCTIILVIIFLIVINVDSSKIYNRLKQYLK